MELPRLIAITDRQRFADEKIFLANLKENLGRGLRAIYLREKDLSAPEFQNLAEKVATLCASSEAWLILPGTSVPLKKVACAIAVQAGKSTPSIADLRRAWGKTTRIGYSAHSMEEALEMDADYFFYSPIFPTVSLAKGEPKGLKNLQIFCRNTAKPVYALGGINSANAESAQKHGAYGVAVLSALQEWFSETLAILRLIDISWRRG